MKRRTDRFLHFLFSIFFAFFSKSYWMQKTIKLPYKGVIRSNKFNIGNYTFLQRKKKTKIHSISVLRWCGRRFPTYTYYTYDIIHISKLLYNDCVFSMRCVDCVYNTHIYISIHADTHIYIYSRTYTSRIKYFYRADLAFLYCPFSFYIILRDPQLPSSPSNMHGHTCWPPIQAGHFRGFETRRALG